METKKEPEPVVEEAKKEPVVEETKKVEEVQQPPADSSNKPDDTEMVKDDTPDI